MSRTTSDKIESMRRVLLHEVAHHLEAIGGEAVSGIVNAAYKSPARHPVTRYAVAPGKEYLAETFVAFHTHRDLLVSYDPVGFKMILDILEALR